MAKLKHENWLMLYFDDEIREEICYHRLKPFFCRRVFNVGNAGYGNVKNVFRTNSDPVPCPARNMSKNSAHDPRNCPKEEEHR